MYTILIVTQNLTNTESDRAREGHGDKANLDGQGSSEARVRVPWPEQLTATSRTLGARSISIA
jgi:hypothetical protein